ncbi:MAG: acyl-CoA synthetase FdrA [Ignavibacteriales bacterium]
MLTKTIVKSGVYYDSATLMRISGRVSGLEGVKDALVGMGTDLNKQSLADVGLLTEEAGSASPNDLLIGLRASDDRVLAAALRLVDGLLVSPRPDRAGAAGECRKQRPRSIAQACRLSPGYNLALISVPGRYAAREAREALRQGMHVFLFSDNVSLEEELALKEMAREKGLLVMGPDCGTAIINGIPLGFANRVRRGAIGIIGASGTGIQQVTAIVDSLGEGVSQAIGTGGRDLSREIGGRTTLSALEALAADPGTRVIVLISKPPAPDVADRIAARAARIEKPLIMCMLGEHVPPVAAGTNVVRCGNLEEAAVQAVSLVRGCRVTLPAGDVTEAGGRLAGFRKPRQQYVRALYGGGTLCDEAMMVFRRRGLPVRSNIPLDPSEALADVEKSEGNTFLDMGEDYFTRGRPHPMLEPGLRIPRLLREAGDPEVAVILFDVVLGYGSHGDPAGIMAGGVQQARNLASGEGRTLAFVAAFVGTAADPQGFSTQRRSLEQAGVIVCASNVRAANLAAALLTT